MEVKGNKKNRIKLEATVVNFSFCIDQNFQSCDINHKLTKKKRTDINFANLH
jgi:hypothetical protein